MFTIDIITNLYIYIYVYKIYNLKAFQKMIAKLEK